MPITCPNCQHPCSDDEQYCSNCGRNLSVVATQQRTVAMRTQVYQPPQESRQQISDRVTQAFGDSPTVVVPGMLSPGELGARELLHLIIDVSWSMAEAFDEHCAKLEAAIRAAVALTLQKATRDQDDEIGLITFSSIAQLYLGLTILRLSKTKLIQAIQSLQPCDGTDINSGLVMASDHFIWDRQDVVRRIVLLTDGHGGRPLQTAAELKERGVVIDVIGIGPTPDAVDESLLRQVASTVDGISRYRFVKDQRTLVNLYTQLGGKTRLGY
jgi:Mg-chelatase subunit ChlD